MEPITMTNLPSFSMATMVAILLANILLLLVIFMLAGPTVIAGRDLFGRVLPVTILRRAVLVLAILGVTSFLAIQTVLVWRFWPYFLDQGTQATEKVLIKAAVPPEGPVVWWIGTENHRFGVVHEIYDRLRIGDTVSVHYRAIDDTLFEITVVERNMSPDPR